MYRVTKQQYTPLLPLNGIEGGRKTSCMACQQKKRVVYKIQSGKATFVNLYHQLTLNKAIDHICMSQLTQVKRPTGHIKEHP